MKNNRKPWVGLAAAALFAMALLVVPVLPAWAESGVSGKDWTAEVVTKTEAEQDDWIQVDVKDEEFTEDSLTASTSDTEYEEADLDASSATARGWLYGDQLTGYSKIVYDLCKSEDIGDGQEVVVTKKVSGTAKQKAVQDAMEKEYLPALMAYMYDYPEKTDYADRGILGYYFKNTSSAVVLHCGYIEDSSYTEELHKKMVSSANALAKKVKAYSSDEKKQLKYLHDWIVKNNVYDYDTMMGSSPAKQFYCSHEPYGCLFLGTGVCESYALAFKVVCDHLDIPCVFVVGDDHAWNYVQLTDNNWYMVDCTWDDDQKEEIDHTYFLCSNRPNIDGHVEETRFEHPLTIWASDPATITSISNTSDGVKITWAAQVIDSDNDEAYRYDVYRKVSGGKWTKLKRVSNSYHSYTDTTAVSGTSYSYCVVCINYGLAQCSAIGTNTRTITRLAPVTAANLTLSNWKSGVKVTWKKVTGAAGYNIYRKTAGGSYALIGKTTGTATLNYLDKTAKNGVTYTYAVRARKGVTLSGYSGKSIARLTTPIMTSLANDASGQMVAKWEANSAAKSYELRYAEDSSFRTNVKTVTMTSSSTLRKTITGLTKGKTYYVEVRTYKKSGTTKYVSGWSSAKKVTITR